MRISGFAVAAVVGLTICVYSCVNEEHVLSDNAVSDDNRALRHGPSGYSPPPPPPPACVIAGNPQYLTAAPGGMLDLELSSDGKKILFLEAQASVNGLYAINSDGTSSPTFLRSTLAAEQTVTKDNGSDQREFSPDKMNFAYLDTDPEDPDPLGNGNDYNLWVLPLSGTASPTKLVPYVNAEFSITPYNNNVFYSVKTGAVSDLRCIPILGGSYIQYGVDGSAHGLKETPDGLTMVYLTPHVSDFTSRLLRSVPSSGGAFSELFTYPPAFFGEPAGHIGAEITNGGSRVVPNRPQSVSITGDPTTVASFYPLNTTPAQNYRDFKINSSRDKFVFDTTTGDGTGVDDYDNLHVGTIAEDNSVVNLTNFVYAPAGERRRITDYSITPDGQTVIFSADKDLYQKYGLYSVPITGGPITTLNLPETSCDPGVPGQDCGVSSFEITPDGQRVIFSADYVSLAGLYSVPIAGGTNTLLDSTIKDGRFELVSNHGVVYEVDSDGDGIVELNYITQAGTGEFVLSAPGSDVRDFKVSTNYSTVALSSWNGPTADDLWARCLPVAP